MDVGVGQNNNKNVRKKKRNIKTEITKAGQGARVEKNRRVWTVHKIIN